MAGNPIYDQIPTTPPGLSGLPYMAGEFIAPVFGGTALPYIAPNQSFESAYAAKLVNRPAASAYTRGAYAQYMQQLGNTAGAMGFVQQLGAVAGYSPEQTRAALAGLGETTGRSMVGSMLMPYIDQGLSSLGLSGGSFLQTMNTVQSSRMNLVSPDTVFNPLNPVQQRNIMGGAMATLSLINGLSSKRDAATGNITLLEDTNFTQGFGKNAAARIMMRMAGNGAFTQQGTELVGLVEQMQQAIGNDKSLETLNYNNGDFFNGVNNQFGQNSEAAMKMKKIAQGVSRKVKGAMEAMGALRDMIHEVNGLEEKLDDLTNGQWLRGGRQAFEARNQVQALNATAQMYNMDPNEAIRRVTTNRDVLLSAALGGDHAASVYKEYGFTGGGLFGLKAQTGFLGDIEDMIRSRGYANDPVMAERLRLQALQAFSRNMNTQAGVAAIMLAYGRQTGAISAEDAARLTKGLSSGDRSVMKRDINEMLVTMYGSTEIGRQRMQDSQYVRGVWEALSDESGDFARRTIMNGAAAEYARQENIATASNHLRSVRSMMTDAGMSTRLQGAQIESVIRAVVEQLRSMPKEGGVEAAKEVEAQYRDRIAKGQSPQMAHQAVMSSLRNNPATAHLFESAKLAAINSMAKVGGVALEEGELSSLQAKYQVNAMRSSGLISGKDQAEVLKLIRDGKSDEALARADSLRQGLGEDRQALILKARELAEEKHRERQAVRTRFNTAVELQREGNKRNLGADFMAKMVVNTVAAVDNFMAAYQTDEQGRQYVTETALDNLKEDLNQSGYGRIYGYKGVQELVDKVKKGKGEEAIAAFRGVAPILQANANDTRTANGYTFEMSGYFMGGSSAGTSEKARRLRDENIKAMAGRMHGLKGHDPTGRQTLAANIYDFLTGEKDIKEVLRLYDRSGKVGSALGDGIQQIQDWQEARDKFADSGAKIANLRNKLNGDAEAIGDFDSILAKAAAGKELEDGVFKSFNKHLSEEDIKSLQDIAGAMSSLHRKESAAMRAMDKITSDEETVAAFSEMQRNKTVLEAGKKREAEARRKKYRRYDYVDDLEISRFLETDGKSYDGLDPSWWSQLFGGDWIKAMGMVSDEDVKKHLNVKDLSGKTPYELTQARLQVLKKQAVEENKVEAQEALEKLRVKDMGVSGSDRITRIEGELVIKEGNEQRPGIINMSTVGAGV